MTDQERVTIMLTREQAVAFLPIAESNAKYIQTQIGRMDVLVSDFYKDAGEAWCAIAEQLRAQEGAGE